MAARRQRFLSPALGTFTAYESPRAWRRGSGQYLFDVDGRRYLDCMAQNVCISVGYRHAGVDAAVRAQLDEIQHVTTVYDHAQPGHFAEELVARLPGGARLGRALRQQRRRGDRSRGAGGAARDRALRGADAARRLPRHAVHGDGGDRHRPRAPAAAAGAPGFVNVMAPHPYRGAFGAEADAVPARAVARRSAAAPRARWRR